MAIECLLLLVVKNSPASAEDTEHGFNPWVRMVPWRREWQPSPVFLPGKSHGQRSLWGYIEWNHKEMDMTEQLSAHLFSLENGERRRNNKQYGTVCTINISS